VPRPSTTRRLVALAALAAAPLLLGGCATLGELAKSAFREPKLTFVRVTVAGLDFEGATLAFDYRLENPNAFGLTLARVRYWLKVEGSEVTRGEVAGGLSIPAAGQAPVRFTARLPFAAVPRLAELVGRREPVAYTVGGLVGVNTPVGQVDVPLSRSDKVALPQLPAFRLEGVSVGMASLRELEVKVSLGVANPNPFPIPAGAIAYQLMVGKEVVATAETAPLSEVAAGGGRTVVIPVRMWLTGAGAAAASALRGGGAQVRLSGEARLGALPVPLEVSGTSR
jgi:LEA14-like dessication related protein